MIPKEKAKDLLEKMNVIHYMKLGGKNSKSKGLPISMHNDQIKGCTLIAIDEIVKECSEWVGGDFSRWEQSRIDYWQEVKQEIEKL